MAKVTFVGGTKREWELAKTEGFPWKSYHPPDPNESPLGLRTLMKITGSKQQRNLLTRLLNNMR